MKNKVIPNCADCKWATQMTAQVQLLGPMPVTLCKAQGGAAAGPGIYNSINCQSLYEKCSLEELAARMVKV